MDIYETCVKLSQAGDDASLRKLLDMYLSTNKNTRKTAKQALHKTKGDLIGVIEKRIVQEKNEENIYRLALMGIRLNRTKFLRFYLDTLIDEAHYTSRMADFRKITMNNPLKDNDMKIITDFICDTNFYDENLIAFIKVNYERDIIDNIIDFVAENGLNKKLLKILQRDISNIDLIQIELRNATIADTTDRNYFIKYLNFNLVENGDIINNIDDFVEVFHVLKENIYGIKLENFSLFSSTVKIIAKVINKSILEKEEEKILNEYIIEKVEHIEDFDNNENFLQMIHSLWYCDFTWIEGVYIKIYRKTKLYSKLALGELMVAHSEFAYREMVSIMLTSEDRKVRYEYAIKLLFHYSEKYKSIFNYAHELNDDILIKTLNTVYEKKISHRISDTDKTLPYSEISDMDFDIIDSKIILSEYINEIASNIQANIFYCATGFLFSSGLKLLKPTLDTVKNNNGNTRFIIGSLHNYNANAENKIIKMDKNTANTVNEYILDYGVEIYTYKQAFYHGKFYYLSGKEYSYVIIGSSNVSRTAYFDNEELNVIYKLK